MKIKLFIKNFIMRLINQPLRISSKKETRRYKISIRLHPSDLFLQFNKKLYFAVAYYKAAVPFSFGYPFLFRYNIVHDIASHRIIFTPNN